MVPTAYGRRAGDGLGKNALYMYNIHIICTDGYVDFEWDARKADANFAKHGVSFESASDAFSDLHARIVPDTRYSDYEDRFFLMGMDLRARVLTVCHCMREGGSRVRIISARKATATEERQDWRYRNE